MRILYGVAGEGFGHATRAKVIINYLLKRGHNVKVLTYGQAVNFLKGFDVFEIHGTGFHFDGRLRKRKTLAKSIRGFLKNFSKRAAIREIMSEKFDLCITDFEPLTAGLARHYKIPLISLDNEHLLTRCEMNVPLKHYFDFVISKMIINLFVSGAEQYILTNLFPVKIKKRFRKNTVIIPPVIRREVREVRAEKRDYTLVYLSKGINQHALELLKEIKRKFIIYGFDTNRKEGNLIFKKASESGFLKDLAGCKEVIATAGLSLMSEAAYLKKPYLALPAKGHFEQMMNAMTLKESGIGDYTENLTRAELKKFLADSGSYERKLKTYKPDYDKIFRVLNRILIKRR